MEKSVVNQLDAYTVYQNPSDFPGKFVVRRFQGETPDKDPVCVVDTIEEARNKIPQNLMNIGRMRADDPVIVETWI